MKEKLEREILPLVSKPSRYVGTEWNAVRKPWDQADVKTVIAFPDVYEVGMSHLGMRILYHLVNEQPEYLMERVFAPWVDLEQELRNRGVPLLSLESGRPLAEFDLIGFTLQYEMSFTNILNMLDLAGIPVRSRDRDDHHPLIIAGGPCAFNPEPLAGFIDLFTIGDGEEVLLEILATYRRVRGNRQRPPRAELLRAMAGIPGVYVPSFYEVAYRDDGGIEKITPLTEAPAEVKKRVVVDLDSTFFPTRPIVPYMEIVHDRMMLEVLRGCSRGCRFCQAGMIYRPVRERSLGVLQQQASELVASTGYDEMALTSLSTSDYTCVQPLVESLLNRYQDRGIGISLPSLRVDNFSVELAQQVQRVRKSGLTFAPEAGTQRLRDVINKGVTEDDLLQTTRAAFAAGWTAVKLYFMIGLPTETRADLDGIVDLARKVADAGTAAGPKRRLRVTISVSSFVPKTHTPFQWEGQTPVEELRERQRYLRSQLKDRRLEFNWHEPEISLLEAVFSRGDRRTGEALELAWRKGCKFDSWSEHFKFNFWLEAFAECGLNPEHYAQRRLDYNEVLPWNHISSGISKDYLIQEHRRALELATTGDCRSGDCQVCGLCPAYDIWPDLKGGERDAGLPGSLS